MACVTIPEAKTALRIEHGDEDAYILGLIETAQCAAENYCYRTFGALRTDGTVEDTPSPVRQAILLLVAHYYENRENTDRLSYAATMMAFHNLLYPYRDPDKMF